MARPSRLRTVDPRDEALRAITALFAKENPVARVDMLREAIDDAIEADPHNDPMAVALSMLGQIQYDAETLASYLKFAVQQSGGFAGHENYPPPQRQAHLPEQVRQTVNGQLAAAGLDGNGRFPSIGAAINVVWGVLGIHGLQIGTTPSANLFRQRPGGDVQLEIEYMNPTDPFSPVQITNSLIHFQYHVEPDTRRVDVVAYLS